MQLLEPSFLKIDFKADFVYWDSVFYVYIVVVSIFKFVIKRLGSVVSVVFIDTKDFIIFGSKSCYLLIILFWLIYYKFYYELQFDWLESVVEI